MKIEIKDTHNGWIVNYDVEDQYGENQYVFKSTEDLILLQDIAKRFLKRRVKVIAE